MVLKAAKIRRSSFGLTTIQLLGPEDLIKMLNTATIRPIAIFAVYSLNYSLAACLQDNSHPKSPTKVETKRKLQQFTVSGLLIINGGVRDCEKKTLKYEVSVQLPAFVCMNHYFHRLLISS